MLAVNLGAGSDQHFFPILIRQTQNGPRAFNIGQNGIDGMRQNKPHPNSRGQVIDNIALPNKAFHQLDIQNGTFVQSDAFVFRKK
jgi:hypothetical protein